MIQGELDFWTPNQLVAISVNHEVKEVIGDFTNKTKDVFDTNQLWISFSLNHLF